MIDMYYLFCFINPSTAPLSSIETNVFGMTSFVHSIIKDYPDVLKDDHYRIINDEEQFILFESNKQQLLANNNLYESAIFTTKSILRNINMLESLGITPNDYMKRLTGLMNSNENGDYKRYTDFGTIYSVYEAFLNDRKLLTVNAVLSNLMKDPCTMDILAKV